MKIELIIKLAEKNAERKANEEYSLLERALEIAPNATVTLKGATDFFFIQDDPTSVKVKSELGVYNTASAPATGFSERIGMHFGTLTITNLSGSVNKSLVLIQQIFAPKQAQKDKGKEININILQQTNISQ